MIYNYIFMASTSGYVVGFIHGYDLVPQLSQKSVQAPSAAEHCIEWCSLSGIPKSLWASFNMFNSYRK